MKKFRKLFAGILALLMTASLPAGAAFADEGGQKSSSTNAIAIVFDNSGSMYYQGSMAWCQATYAMEVFAAMMDSGDTLQIYPMNEADINGANYSSDSPLVISSMDEAAQIQDIFTHGVGITPIETIMVAHDGLVRTSADERWLIVLTDGDTFYENDTEMGHDATLARLSELLTQYNQDVNVVYLGIGDLSVPDFASSNGYVNWGETATSAQVPGTLSRVCNLIFGRDELPAENLSGGQISFDIPMRKLIVFVQGENVGDITLTAPDGSQVPAVSTYSPHYSTKGTGGYTSVPDTTLQGVIETYGACPSGAYGLSYSGTASSVIAYYEPDVDLAVFLTDETGAAVDLNGDIYPGQYSLSYGIADSSGTLLDSALLGDTQYDIALTVNGDTQTISSDRSEPYPLELAADDLIDVSASARFLSGYQINKDAGMLGWPSGGLSVAPWPVGTLTAEVTGGSDTYGLYGLEEQGHYDVALRYDGELLQGEALDRTDLQAALTGGNASCAVERTDGGYALDLGYAEDVGATESGAYELALTASYVDENGQTSETQQTVRFEIEEQTSSLQVKLEDPRKYYVISRLDEQEPLVASITKDGEPLTAEELAAVDVTAEAEGLDLRTEVLADQSAAEVYIEPNGDYATGTYPITVSAKSQDELGRQIEGTDKASIKLQKFPQWVWYLGFALLALLIALLIWLYMNVKILPKKIGVKQTTFTVDGNMVTGAAQCLFTGGKKKRGILEIQTPKYTANPLLKAGFHLDLEAVSPRRVKSSARSAKVTGVSAINASAVSSIRIGAVQLIKDPATRKFVRAGGAKNVPLEFLLNNGARCTVVAEVLDPNGGTASVSLVTILRYY